MLPADVVTRLVNGPLFVDGFIADEVVSKSPHYDNLWALSVSLRHGENVARSKGLHGIAAHILRGYGKGGLYTPQEWQILLDRARKTGIEQQMRVQPTENGSMSLWAAYNQAYAKYSSEQRREFMEQELVGRLAEYWSLGRSYGTKIDALLERLARFIEAVVNAMRGLGFQSVDDIFERVQSGEVAARSGMRADPSFGSLALSPEQSAAPVQPGGALHGASVNSLAAEIRQAVADRHDDLAENVRFAVGLWQAQGGDPRTGIGEALAEALAVSGHTDLATRVIYGPRSGQEFASFGSQGPWGPRKGWAVRLQWLRVSSPNLVTPTAQAPDVKVGPFMDQDARERWLSWALSPYANAPEARAPFLPRRGTPAQKEAAWQALIENVRRDYETWSEWRDRAQRARKAGHRAPSPPPHRAWRPPKR